MDQNQYGIESKTDSKKNYNIYIRAVPITRASFILLNFELTRY